jgi:hypothetical protein
MPLDSAMATAFDVHGSGETGVLVHAGIADRRMWEPQWHVLCEHRRVVRLDSQASARRRSTTCR